MRCPAFSKFYDGLDDLERLHRAYPIARDDPLLRDRLRNDVIRMICPMYARFLAKHRTGDFSKSELQITTICRKYEADPSLFK